MGLSCKILLGPKSSVRCPEKRKAEALRHAEGKASQRGRQRLEFCCLKQEPLEPAEAGRDKEGVSPKASEGVWACWRWDLGLLLSTLWGIMSIVLCHHIYGSIKKWMHQGKVTLPKTAFVTALCVTFPLPICVSKINFSFRKSSSSL